jgi:hypothetical protein
MELRIMKERLNRQVVSEVPPGRRPLAPATKGPERRVQRQMRQARSEPWERQGEDGLRVDNQSVVGVQTKN